MLRPKIENQNLCSALKRADAADCARTFSKEARDCKLAREAAAKLR
jgi:hypothetical protein